MSPFPLGTLASAIAASGSKIVQFKWAIGDTLTLDSAPTPGNTLVLGIGNAVNLPSTYTYSHTVIKRAEATRSSWYSTMASGLVLPGDSSTVTVTGLNAGYNRRLAVWELEGDAKFVSVALAGITTDSYTFPLGLRHGELALATILRNASAGTHTLTDASFDWQEGVAAAAHVFDLVTPYAPTVAAPTGRDLMMVLGGFRWQPVDKPAFAPTYIGAAAVTVAATNTITLEDVPIGAASAERTVIVAMNCRGSSANRSINSVTLNGLPMACVSRSPNGWFPNAMFEAKVPSGTTADIVLTTDVSTTTDAVAFIWTFDSHVGRSGAAAFTGGIVADPTATFDAAEDGVVLACLGRGTVDAVLVGSPVDELTAWSTHYYQAGSLYPTAAGSVVISGDTVDASPLAAAAYFPMTAGTTVYDDFERTATTSLSASVATSGHAWIVFSGVVGITGGAAYRSSGNAFAGIDFGLSDMRVSVTLGVLAATYGGPSARIVDVDNFYYVHTGGSGTLASLRKQEAGVDMSVGGTTYALVLGDEIGIQCKEVSGDTEVKLLINGTVVETLTDSSPTRPNSTIGGIRPYSSATPRYADFTIEEAS